MERIAMPACLARWPGFVLGWASGIGLRYYEGLLAPLGFKAGHVAVLVLLESEGETVQARLGEQLQIDKATMAGLLRELEERKFIARRRDPEDKRALRVRLLRAGGRKLIELKKISDEGTRAFFSVLSPEEQELLHRLLVRIAEQC